MKTRRDTLKLMSGAALAPLVAPSAAFAGNPFAATEFTQILNNIQLLGNVGNTAATAVRMATSIANQALQIQNQINAYRNMIENTLSLPSQLWGEMKGRIGELWDMATETNGLSYRQANADDVIRERFWTSEDYQESELNKAELSARMNEISSDFRERVAESFTAAGIISADMERKNDILEAAGQMAESPRGAVQVAQAAAQIAGVMAQTLQQLNQQFANQATLTNEYRAIQEDRAAAERAALESFTSDRPESNNVIR